MNGPTVERIYSIRIEGYDASLKGLQNITAAFAKMDAAKKKADEQLKKAVDTGNVSNVERLTKRVADLERQLQSLDKTREVSQKKLEALEAKQDILNQKKQQEALKTQKLQDQQTDRVTKQAAAEQRLTQQITDEYAILNKALRDAEVRYKNLYLVKGKDHEATQQALKDALGIRDMLEDIDVSLRNYQRRVGQYSGEFVKAFDLVKDQIAKLKIEQQGLQDLGARNPLGFDTNRYKDVTAQLQTLEQVQRVGFQTTQSYTEQVRNLDAAFEQLVSTGNQDAAFLQQLNNQIQRAKAGTQSASKEFNNLNFTVTQLLRETPSLAINLQTFFLAISNNLPQFVEAIEKAKVANNDLATSGQKPVSVLSQIGKSLFSVQSLFTIGVTLLTVFGGKLIEWAGKLFKGSDATEKLDRDLKILNATLAQVKDSFQKVNTEIDNMAERRRLTVELQFIDNPAKAGLINTRRDLGDLADKAQQAEIAYQKAGDAVIAIQNKVFETLSRDDEELLFEKGISNFADVSDEVFKELSVGSQKVITSYKEAVKQQDEFGKKTTELQEQLKTGKYRVQLEEARFTKEQQEKARDAAKEAADKQREIIERNAKAILEIKKLYLEKEIAFQRAFANTDTDSIIRISAREQQFLKEKELIETEANYELNQGKKTAKEIELITAQRNEKVRLLEAQLASDIIQIRVTATNSIRQEALSYADALEAGMKERKQQEEDNLTKGFEREQQAFETGKNKRLTVLNTEYKEGKLSKEQYEKEKQKIEQNALVKSLNNQIAYYTSLAKIYEFDVTKKQEALDKIAALEAARSAIGLPGADKTQQQAALPGQGGLLDIVKSKTRGKVNSGKDKDGNAVDGNELLGYALADSYSVAQLAMETYFDAERAQVEKSKDLAYQRIDLEKQQLLAQAQSQAERDDIEKRSQAKKRQADREAGEKLKQIKKSEAKIALSTELANIAVAAAQNPLNGITLGAAGIAMYAALAGMAFARYALNVKAIEAQQFAGGGQVKPPLLSRIKSFFTGGQVQQVQPVQLNSGKVSVASNIPTQANGDDVLATVKVGEVILNEEQQRKLGGPAIFKNIGVPGFADGGIVQPSFGGLTFGGGLQAPENPAAFLLGSTIQGSETKQLFEMINQQSANIDQLSDGLKTLASQTNQRIDKIKVINNPLETVDSANKFKAAQSVGTI